MLARTFTTKKKIHALRYTGYPNRSAAVE